MIPSPYVIQVDCIHAAVGLQPRSLIAVMGYVTGTPDIKWTDQDWARFPYAGKLRVDQTPQLEEFAALDADVADVEPRAGTLEAFIPAARTRAHAGHSSTLYISWGNGGSELARARQEVDQAGGVGGVRYFIAEYSWSMQTAIAFMDDPANSDVVGVQFATPGSNPRTILPGTDHTTLAQAAADLSVKRASWFGSAALPATGWTE